MANAAQQPIISLAFKAGYDDGHLCGRQDVLTQSAYFDTPGDDDGGEYCQGFKWGYADGYSGVEPLAIELELNELENGDMEYTLTYENNVVKVS